MKFGNLEIDPAVNPAVLDTATWDPEGAWQIVRSVEPKYWHTVLQALAKAESLPIDDRCTVYRGSWAQRGASTYLLSRLSDGQHVFVEIGPVDRRLIAPLHVMPLGGGIHLAMYAADAPAIRSYVQKMRPDKGPRAMGAVPRLGIGTRMSTSVWPGIWRAMDERKFAANAIQNSVRELNLLEDVLAGRPARTNYLYGFGTLPEGHTGSTFEGLWVAGVIEALKSDTQPELWGGCGPHHDSTRAGRIGASQTRDRRGPRLHVLHARCVRHCGLCLGGRRREQVRGSLGRCGGTRCLHQGSQGRRSVRSGTQH